jgi:hypothetical protein
MRLKSSSACAYINPKTTSASVFPRMWAIPQSSRVIVTFCACCSQRWMSSLAAFSDGPAHAMDIASARSSFFMSSSVG